MSHVARLFWRGVAWVGREKGPVLQSGGMPVKNLKVFMAFQVVYSGALWQVAAGAWGWVMCGRVWLVP